MLHGSTIMSELQLCRVETFGFVKEETTRVVGTHPSHLKRRFNRNPSDGKRRNLLWLSIRTFCVDQYVQASNSAGFSILISANP